MDAVLFLFLLLGVIVAASTVAVRGLVSLGVWAVRGSVRWVQDWRAERRYLAAMRGAEERGARIPEAYRG